MRFSHKDKKDERVSQQSTYPFEFPQKLDQAPKEQGVFVLLNATDDVLYVGCAAAGGIAEALSVMTGAISDAVTYRWFVTETAQVAEALAQDWIGKYQPDNQNL